MIQKKHLAVLVLFTLNSLALLGANTGLKLK
jgi:hypothetical protein